MCNNLITAVYATPISYYGTETLYCLYIYCPLGREFSCIQREVWDMEISLVQSVLGGAACHGGKGINGGLSGLGGPGVS